LDPFQLTDDAIFDIDAIWRYLLQKDGIELADQTVTEFFKFFYRLADIPASGHRRPDLTDKKVLFYRVFSIWSSMSPEAVHFRFLAYFTRSGTCHAF
jgi:plasmid stabilization system protein ParE